MKRVNFSCEKNHYWVRICQYDEGERRIVSSASDSGSARCAEPWDVSKVLERMIAHRNSGGLRWDGNHSGSQSFLPCVAYRAASADDPDTA